MAEYLASIFGTEKDKVNCSFYFKIGACRHGDRCSRIHNKPTFSQTLLLQNLYQNPQNVGQTADGANEMALQGIKLMSDEEAQEHFDNFFEDVFIELEDKYGEIEEMNVCDNLGDHLVGNVYVKFRREEDADKASNELNNRWFGGRPIYAELSPVTDFREACCRQYEMGECTRSGFCNFMHLKPISRELRRELYGRRRAAAIERRLASYVTGRSRSRSLSPRPPRERRRSGSRERRRRSGSRNREPREGREVPEGREARGGREGQEGREARGGREVPEGREARGGREVPEGREARGGREVPEGREARGGREVPEGREPRGGREGQDGREARGGREGREGREAQEGREPRGVREGREGRERRSRSPRDRERRKSRDKEHRRRDHEDKEVNSDYNGR